MFLVVTSFKVLHPNKPSFSNLNPLLYRVSNPQNMGQACNCNNLSNSQETTMDPKRQKLYHKMHSRTSELRFQFLLDDKDLLEVPATMSITDTNSNMDTSSLIQPAKDDMVDTSTPPVSTNDLQKNSTKPPSSISDQETLPSHEENDGYDKEDEANSGNGNKDDDTDDDDEDRPNLFRPNTRAEWNFSDIDDLEDEMKQELQSMQYDTSDGKSNQVSETSTPHIFVYIMFLITSI